MKEQNFKEYKCKQKKQMVQKLMNVRPRNTLRGEFPKTTKEDFHNNEVFRDFDVRHNAVSDKRYNRKISDFLGFVEAFGNKGVYQKPTKS